MGGVSDRRSVSAGHFRSNDLLEARESARAGNELLEFTQLAVAGARSAPATYILDRLLFLYIIAYNFLNN